MKLLKDILTDYDGQTFDTGRCIGVGIVLAMLVFEAFGVYHARTFDAQAFGAGMGAVLAALGVAIGGDNHKRPDR